MNIVIGPVLHLRSCTDDTWRLRVVVVAASASGGERVVFRSDVGTVQAPLKPLFSFAVTGQDRTALSADLTLPRGAQDQVWSYRVEVGGKAVELGAVGERMGGLDPEGWVSPVVVPAINVVPRMAFFSCNGFSSGRAAQSVVDPDVLWRDLARRHERDSVPGEREGPWHAIIGGGDQVYADWLWVRDTEMSDFLESGRSARSRTRASPHRRRRLTARWLDLYQRFWHRGSIGWAAARIPGLYTWDDHDIVDGWGSEKEHHDEEGFGFWDDVIVSAGLTFDVVQCGHRPGRDRYRHVRLRSTGASVEIWMLDGRSSRTREQTLGEAQWRWIKERKAELAVDPPDHLLVVVSIPPVYLRFPRTAALALTPFELDDDLRDQWEFGARRGERARLLVNLAELQAELATRVTVLSGDVHVGSRAEVVLQRPGEAACAPVHQLVSSGIVHPPPTALELGAMRIVSTEGPDAVAEHVTATLMPVGGEPFLRSRNYLHLLPERTPSGVTLWAQWVRAANHSEVPAVVPEKVVVRPQ